MSINAILACDINGGIGNKNGLPWPRNKQDMKWFRDHTLGHVIVMGRGTWESIGSKSLPKRENIVISRNVIDVGMSLSGDMERIIEYISDLYPGLHIWIIGGADIFHQSMTYCDKLYLTRFNQEYECDTFISEDMINQFSIVDYEDKNNSNLTFQIRSRK